MRLFVSRLFAGGVVVVSSSCVAGCQTTPAQHEPAPAEVRSSIDTLREDVRAMITTSRDHVYPALVNISVVTVQYWNGKDIRGRATGSGTIISPEGYIITNQHVTDGGEEFVCTLADKQEIPAKLIGEDPLTDLAVLQLDLDAYDRSQGALPVASFGDSSALTVGDYVMAMGSPFSLSRSVTLGIVSNTERIFAGGVGNADIPDMELESGQRTGLFTNWIQHDALIQPGNSGGPLVNLNGQIVGINELGGNSMGFAIPSNLAQQVVDLLIEHGEVPRSWVGISVRTIENTGMEAGILVSSVVDDSPAQQAQLEPGDVITHVDGQAVTIRFLEQIPPFMKRIADIPIGTELRFSVQRDGSERDVTITTSRMLQDLGTERALRAWGITVRDITPRMARDLRLPSDKGVLVTSVRSGSPAEQAKPALSWGDVLLQVDDSRIDSLDDVLIVYRELAAMEDKPERLMLEFDRRGKNHLTLIKPEPDTPSDPPRELPKAWLGVTTQPITNRLAAKLGDAKLKGYRVTRVYPGTLAATTDLRIGDIVLAVNGKPTAPRNREDAGQLARALRRLDIDSVATLTLLRNNQEIEVAVTLEGSPLPRGEAKREKNDDFDMSVRELTFYDRDDSRWDQSVQGVLVESVETGGWAEIGGLQPREVIQRIGDTRIDSIESYRDAMEHIEQEKPQRVSMIVLHGSQTRYLVIETDWSRTTTAEDSP